MKKVLITGANSYIGTSFEKFLNKNYPNEYLIDTIDMVDGSWKERNFSGYDSVFHVAGIAHQKETAQNAALYYRVNRDLAINTAVKAKKEGVKQFVFLSSMSVYGLEEGIITRETIPNPKSHYGKSKYEAECQIVKLASDEFKVCVLRPPMVYGKDCKGNYQSLVKIASFAPVFPDYRNQRSMIHIDVLSEAVKLCIENNKEGIFCPQNATYCCTSDLVKEISESMGRKIIFTSMLNLLVQISLRTSIKAKKAFGNLIYQNFDNLE